MNRRRLWLLLLLCTLALFALQLYSIVLELAAPMPGIGLRFVLDFLRIDVRNAFLMVLVKDATLLVFAAIGALLYLLFRSLVADAFNPAHKKDSQ